MGKLWAGAEIAASEARKNPALCGAFQVGTAGFEPATFRPPAGCATKLRHVPRCAGTSIARPAGPEQRAAGLTQSPSYPDVLGPSGLGCRLFQGNTTRDSLRRHSRLKFERWAQRTTRDIRQQTMIYGSG